MVKRKLIPSITLFIILFSSCDYFRTKETHYIKIDLYANKPLCNGELPSELKSMLAPFEISESKKLGFIPKITVHRLDLNSKDSMLIEPQFSRSSIQKLPYAQEAQEVNQMLETIGCNNYLSKPSERQESMKDFVYNKSNVLLRYESTKDSILEKIKQTIFENGSVIEKQFIVLYKITDEISERDTISIGDGNYSTLPDYEWLRQELLKIIDTKKSTEERQELAVKIWKEHFYQECYVDNYMDVNDKNPEYWSPKNGVKYLTEHLVGFPSIIDIKILSVERDKETQKISGLKVCEIYNGSKFNN